MAVRIPDFTDVGTVNPQPAGGLPNFPASNPVAEGTAALGKGLQEAGNTVSDIDLYQQLAKDKLEEANATVDLFSRVDPLKAQIAKETDPAKVAELQQQAQGLTSVSGQAISNPLRRQMWMATHARTVSALGIEADTRNTVLGREQAVADIHASADKAVRTAVGSDDPQAVAIAQQAINDLGEYGKGYGSLTPEGELVFKKQQQRQLYIGKADRLIEQGRPDQAGQLLEAHREDIDAVSLERLQLRIAGKANKITTDGAALRALGLPTTGLGLLASGDSAAGDVGQRVAQTLRARGWSDAAVTGALNNAITESSLNPTTKGAAGEVGLFQFHPATHLPQFAAKSGGDFSPEAQANYVADVVEKTMPGYAQANDVAQATTQFMRGFERPADQSATATQARVANTAASTAIAKVQPIPTGAEPAAQPQPAQSRTGLPSLTDAYTRILRDPAIKTDEQVRQAFGTATTIHNAMEADAARAERIQAQHQKAAMEGRENQIWADVYGQQPKITAQQIAVDPAFNGNPERRKAMIELINNPPGSAVPAAQSYQAAQSMIERMRLPEGDPNKITTKDQIYDQMRSLNRADLEYTLTKLGDLSSPGDNRFSKRLEDFFKGVEPQIDRSGALPGLPQDGKGKAKAYEYRRMVEDQVSAYRAGGKNPDDLINPKNSAYLGNPDTLKPYKRTLTEALADFTTDAQGGAPQSAVTAPAIEITATGPDGTRIALRNGQWVDMKSGQPLPPAGISPPLR